MPSTNYILSDSDRHDQWTRLAEFNASANPLDRGFFSAVGHVRWLALMKLKFIVNCIHWALIAVLPGNPCPWYAPP